jgi:hypothetical protein
MTRLLERVTSADGLVARCSDRIAARLLPRHTAAAGYYRCTCQSCGSGRYYRCYYTNGYWTGDCYCSSTCSC